METKYLAFCRNSSVKLSAAIPPTNQEFPITLGWQDTDGLRVYLEITPTTAALIHSRKFTPGPSKVVSAESVTSICPHSVEISEDDLTNFKLFMQHGLKTEVNDFLDYSMEDRKKVKSVKINKVTPPSRKDKGKDHAENDVIKAPDSQGDRTDFLLRRNSEINITEDEMIQICNWKAWMKHSKRASLAEALNDENYEEHLKLDLAKPFTVPRKIKLVIKGRTAKVYFFPSPLVTREMEVGKDKHLVLTFDRIGCAPTTPNAYDTLGVAKIIKYGVEEKSVVVKY